MGNVRKRPAKFQAQVRCVGVKLLYKIFVNKKDAIVWVRRIEVSIDFYETNLTAPKVVTLGDVLKRSFRKSFLKERLKARTEAPPSIIWGYNIRGSTIKTYK